MTEFNYECKSCGDKCELVAETIHYSGTNCNSGKDGVHKTGHLVSDCCDSDYREVKSDD